MAQKESLWVGLAQQESVWVGLAEQELLWVGLTQQEFLWVGLAQQEGAGLLRRLTSVRVRFGSPSPSRTVVPGHHLVTLPLTIKTLNCESWTPSCHFAPHDSNAKMAYAAARLKAVVLAVAV